MVHKVQKEDEPPAYRLILDASVKYICSNIEQFAPEGAVKSFLLWLLNPNSPHYSDYLQISGINKMAELGTYWLSGIFDLRTTESLADYLGALNAYFFFEVVSDNLAMGLARPAEDDSEWQNRKEILLHFNAVMEKKLSGSSQSAFQLLEPLVDKINTISCFDQSLTSGEIKNFANAFLKLNPSYSMLALNKSAMTYLILNIESCLYCLNLFADKPQIKTLLLQSLNSRYQAVSSLLQMKNSTSLSLLTQWGLYSILVVPTLLYLIAALDKIKPSHQLTTITNDGLILKALEAAAVNIRLLNDIGTHLLQMSSQDILKLQNNIYNLFKDYDCYQSENIFVFLKFLAAHQDFYHLFARIRKDIEHREFNISLDNLYNDDNFDKNFDRFFDNIKFFANLYQEKRNELGELFTSLNDLLQDDSIGQLIMKMVVFHEQLYAREFENNQGDYATHR